MSRPRSYAAAAPRRRTGALCLALIATLLGACAPAASVGSAGADQRVATRAEIADSRRANLLEFVQSYRPQWLRARGSAFEQSPVVIFLDGVRIGEVDALQGISTDFAGSLRYVTGPEAVGRWGPGHGSGAILITSLGRMTAGRRGVAEPGFPSG